MKLIPSSIFPVNPFFHVGPVILKIYETEAWYATVKYKTDKIFVPQKKAIRAIKNFNSVLILIIILEP